MKNLLPRLLALLMLMGVGAAFAVEVTDDRGVTVHFDKPPQRIVSLLPSLTETVCELGRCQRLVGVDRYSNYPASVQGLAQVGGGLDPNIESIVALRPDLVLMMVTFKIAPSGRRVSLALTAPSG